MDVVLFRHGIAIERDEWEGEEADRPLTPKGRRRTRQAAEGLVVVGLTPTHLFVSPLARARETADILHDVLRSRVTIRICDELIPEALPDKLLTLLGPLPAQSTVLCVGHEPNLSTVAGHMLSGRAMAGLSLKKAGSCLIHFEEAPRSGKGSLEWWLPPSVLRAL